MIKWFILIFHIVVVIGCTTSGKNVSEYDINGVWVDSNSTNFRNAVLILAEKNGEVNMSHYLEWNGQKFLEYGSGKRVGNNIVYDTEVTIKINGWATKGTHDLILSEDGKTLRGTFIDNYGRSGPIVFKKLR